MNSPSIYSKQKIAIVFDWLTTPYGGVERLLPSLLELFPHADVYTSSWDEQSVQIDQTNHAVVQSWLRHIPMYVQRQRVIWLLIYPFIFQSFDFSSYTHVISVCSAFSKSIVVKPPTTHISYVLTPTRYLWGNQLFYRKQLHIPGIFSTLGSLIIGYLLRKFDLVAAQKPDRLISISKAVQNRVWKYYRRSSQVIYPPFNTLYWEKVKRQLISYILPFPLPDRYFLIVGRLEQYKNIEMALEVIKKTQYALVVVGKGSLQQVIRNESSKKIILLDHVSDIELGYLYSHAEALIMPQEEDFGYVSLESQFFGCPVIGYAKGGCSETVTDGQTGIHFHEQSQIALMNALAEYQHVSYNLHKNLRSDGTIEAKFGLDRFKKEFISALNDRSHND